MKVLFVCNQNLNRSKTAEEIFRNRFETRSAGLYNERPLNSSQLGWADVVVVMEEEQREEIARRFPALYMKKKIVNIDVPDIYAYMSDELVRVLKRKVFL